MRLARTIVALVVLGSSESLAIGDTWAPRSASIEECRERTRGTKDIAAWYCYYRLAYERRDLIPAIVRHLERIRAREPENIRASFFAAMADDLRDDGRARYDRVQEEFRKRGDVEGEFYVTMAAAVSAAWYGDPERGEAKWARGISLAPQLGDPDVLAFAFQMGTELALIAADYGHAEVRIRQAEKHLTAGAPAWMQFRVPCTWGRVYSVTGRPWRALEAYQRAAVAAAGDPTHRAYSLQGCAEEAVRLASAGELPTEAAEQRLEEALVAARAGVASWQTGGELPLVMLRHALRGPRPGATDELQAILVRGRDTQSFLQITAARLLARFAVETDPRHPEGARALTDEALSEARNARTHAWEPLAHLARAHVDWRSGDRGALVRQAEVTLDSVDRLRWSQAQTVTRARTSAEWAFAYELLAGWLLEMAGPEPSGSAVEPAFATMERLRGRILLDELARSGVASASPSPEVERRWRR